MDSLYWIGEYGKVFCAYVFLMFIWPSAVFSNHLKNKDKIYRFSFCVTVQIINVNSVVLMLGLFHILNRWIVVFIFYGIFIASALKRIKLRQWLDGIKSLYRIATETYGLKSFIYDSAKKIRLGAQSLMLKYRKGIRPRFPEYAVLGVLILYGMIYFSYGVFQDFNYGCGDMYVHHQWIDGLLDGKIFYDGVYPEGMHCFLYCLHTMFGIRLYNCILFLAGIHVSVTLISAYAFLKEIFDWRYTPFFVLAAFLTLDLMCIGEVYGMSRLQWTLPQDFGMYTQFLCTLFLIRYLKSYHSVITEKKLRKFIWNENLLVFMMTLAASVSIHFYTTIMAFLLCISFAVFYIRKLLKKERFFPLIAAVLCSLCIAVIPMAGAFMSGIPFQDSIFWATSVINNEAKEAHEEISEENISWENLSFGEKVETAVSVIYWRGYVNLYQKERADWIIGLTGLSTALCIACKVIRPYERLRTKKKLKEKHFSGYLPVIISSVLFMIVYVSSALGMPQLIAGPRICVTEQLLLLAVIAIPADMVFTILMQLCTDMVLRIWSVGITVGIYFFTIMTGTYHGYLYCELSRYNAAVKVTNSIIDNFPQYSYTIVSCTDELYHVNRYGRHEELLTFVQGIDTEEYKLPTEYVFVYVEKKPIEYAQNHLFQGPAWLGTEKYVDVFGPSVSQCPEIRASHISAEEARKEIDYLKEGSLVYRNLESRTILESQTYLWCQNFMRLFPYKMDTYYEDEDFVCYYFKQNPYELYNLAIEGWNRTDGVEW